MKLSKLIQKLQSYHDHYGDLNVVCPGDHQEEYKIEYVTIEHIEEGETGGYTVIHHDDLDYHEDPEMVVSIS